MKLHKYNGGYFAVMFYPVELLIIVYTLLFLVILTGCSSTPVVTEDDSIERGIDNLCMNEKISGETTYAKCRRAWE